ncbi:hypothetical protein CBS101457_002899 [Exobasidium rhododendri]|nr:hypothetical protein CBS101457_002899 [Exobasidium rhododendri]
MRQRVVDEKANAGQNDSSSQGEQHTDTSSRESAEKKKAPPPTPSIIPAWVTSNLSNTRSLKVLLRCWLASWSTLILILPTASLNVLGQAAFFAMLLTFMIPANMPLSIFLMLNFTLVVGSLLGWAWSCAAMAASLRARNQVILQQELETTYSYIATNPEAQFQVIIFQGRFLDVRSTAVFGIFLVFGAYASGIVQAKLPKLKIAGIFFLIIVDIMCAYGPLFPFGDYTLATILLIPIGCSLAISTACQFIVFPESLSTSWQYNLVKMLGLARQTVGLHRSALERMLEEEPEAVEADIEPKIRQLHLGVVGLAQAMGDQRAFLKLEATYERLNAADLAQIYTEIRTVIVRMFGLNAFFHLLEKHEGDDNQEQRSGPVALNETHAILSFRRHLHRLEAEHNVELKSLLPILIDASRRTLKAVDACLESSASWIDASVKKKRNYNHDTWINQLEVTNVELEEAYHAFMNEDRLKLLEPYKYLFAHPDAHLSEESQMLFRNTARPLYICLVFMANLSNFAEEMMKSHTAILALAKKRSKNRFWFPTGLHKLGSILFSGKSSNGPGDASDVLANFNKYGEQDDDSDDGDGDDDSDENKKEPIDSQTALEERAGRPQRRNPDALPPTKALHHFGRFISSCYHFFWSPASVYGIRFAVVSFAVWLPSVLPSSAYFVYLNRGLWALIMCQTGMAMTGGELVFSLTGRLAGTLTGLVLGMLYWYMSCGLAADGNAYGLAAVCAFGFLPIVFLRIFAPPALMLPAIMTGVTTALCVGYSWINTHLTVLANSGVGYTLAWKRALLVIIGMVAAFAVTIFPAPPSTRQQVRMGFARITDEVAQLYALIVESWIVLEVDDHDKRSDRQEKLHTVLRSRFINAQGVLGGLNRDVNLASFDVAFIGTWPKDKYIELLHVHARLLESISQIASAITGLDVDWRQRMLHTTAILNPKTISEISMTLNLLASALRTAQPLPHASTLLLESMILNEAKAKETERLLQAKAGTEEDLLTLKAMLDPQFMRHTAAVMAIITFVRQLDRFRALARDLVGEIDLPGYDNLKRLHDQRHIRAYLGEEAA